MRTTEISRTVVAGVDGSINALQAIRWAAVEAARRRLPLRDWCRPAQVLQSESVRAAVLVLGDRGAGGLARLTAGAVAVGVANHLEAALDLDAVDERHRRLTPEPTAGRADDGGPLPGRTGAFGPAVPRAADRAWRSCIVAVQDRCTIREEP